MPTIHQTEKNTAETPREVNIRAIVIQISDKEPLALTLKQALEIRDVLNAILQ